MKPLPLRPLVLIFYEKQRPHERVFIVHVLWEWDPTFQTFSAN